VSAVLPLDVCHPQARRRVRFARLADVDAIYGVRLNAVARNLVVFVFPELNGFDTFSRDTFSLSLGRTG
jgi:hypothetical protein